MTQGFYVERDSPIHRLHPVTKIALLIMSFASALLLSHPLWLLLLGLVYAGFGARAGALTAFGKVAWILVLVAVASFIIWSLSYDGGTVLVSLGPVEVSREGMLYGAAMGIRLDLMAFCGLILLASTPVEDFNYGLTRMGVPFSVSFALSLSFRLVPLFAETMRSIQDAQRARGLDPMGGGPMKKASGFVALLAPVFASSLRRADQLAIALESRGFGRPGRRGAYREHGAGMRDAVAVLVMAVLIALEVLARLHGFGGLD